MLSLLLTLAGIAHARCAITREATATGARVTVRALSEPVTCREVTLASDRPLTATVRMLDEAGRSRRLRGAHLGSWPGGGVRVFAPELEAGGALDLDVTVPGTSLAIVLGNAETLLAGVPSPGVRVDVERTILLDPKDPSYGFVLPRRARTQTLVTWRGAAPQDPARPLLLHVPDNAETYTVATADTEAGPPVSAPAPPGGVVLAPSGSGSARWEEPGATAIGSIEALPGTHRIVHGGVRWAFRLPSDATLTEVPGVAEIRLPTGGHLAWRAIDVRVGDTLLPVVATAQRYLEGLDWRFARASLPEPAVPFRLRGMDDRDELLGELYAEVSGLRDGRLADTRTLHPRPLGRAWRSGWATPTERALILHRMLVQEKFEVRWYLTGEDPDPVSFDGFDRMLLEVRLDGEGGTQRTLWLDPACGACSPGEVSPTLVGKPLLGSETRVPGAPGSLERTLALHGDLFTVEVRARGAAATWLRESVRRVEPEQRERIVLTLLGVRDGHAVALSGFDTDEDVRIEAHTTRPPARLFPAAAGSESKTHPWDGPLRDLAEMDPAVPAE